MSVHVQALCCSVCFSTPLPSWPSSILFALRTQVRKISRSGGPLAQLVAVLEVRARTASKTDKCKLSAC